MWLNISFSIYLVKKAFLGGFLAVTPLISVIAMQSMVPFEDLDKPDVMEQE